MRRASPQVDGLQAGVAQVVVGPFVNVSLLLDLVVVRQTVDFMNEHLKVDVWVYFVGSGHGEMQPAHGLRVVILPGTRHPVRVSPGTGLNQLHQGVHDLTWESITKISAPVPRKIIS